MNIIFLTLGVSLMLSITFLGLFLWSTKKGQYDDLVTPGQRLLIDENNKNNTINEKLTEENADE